MATSTIQVVSPAQQRSSIQNDVRDVRLDPVPLETLSTDGRRLSSAGQSLDALPPPASSPVRQSTPIKGINRWRFLSTCTMGFGNGLNDSVPGALIPYMEADYGIGYAIVSLIFVTNAIGFITAAPLTHLLESRLGRARAYIVAEALMAVGYIIIVCKPPFALVVVAFFFIGLGEAFDLAMNNVFCANLGSGNNALGALHGSYGLGGTVGPLMATAMASHGVLWARFYGIALGIVVANAVFAGWAFFWYERDQEDDSPTMTQPPPTSGSTRGEVIANVTKTRMLKQALHNRVTLFGAMFIFAYQGAEVSISGWVISFLIDVRSGIPSSVGYVTAGFWGGITVGRFLLSPLATRLGPKYYVAGLTAGSMAFQFLVWFLPNIVGDAVAVAIIGLLLGPVYPCATAVFGRLLPRSLQISSLGFIAAMGSSGGAVAPLVTGLIAQSKGTAVLHPICIALYVLMEASWGGLPRLQKRRE